MADFAAEVRRLMTERGMSLRGLAKASNYDPSYLSKVLSGHEPSSPYLAARLDDALGAGGAIRDAAQQPPPRRAGNASTPRRKPSGAVEALQVAMTGDPAGPDIGADGLAELVRHYAHALAVAPSAAVYGELLSARSFAGTLLGRSAPRQRPDLTVTAGWLSSLLAISAADLGEHAAAVIWCTDTERRGRDAAYPGTARLGGADPVADRLVPGRPAGLGGRRPAPPGRRAARVGSARQACRPGDALPGDARRYSRDGRRQAQGRRRDGAARPVGPGRQRVLGPQGRGPALHRDLAAAGRQVRRGGADDPADHRHGLPPAGPGPLGPADQLRPNAPDPRPRRRRASAAI